ncbi:MAG: xanthine dehydrogenase family protein molybdopterin-binding subunit, partial [Actinomycetota bacterium]
MSLGRSTTKIDAVGKTTGQTAYAGDLFPDGVLHAKVVFTNQPHARLIDLDTTACEAAPGVVAVVTAADVPVNEYGLTMFDQPVLIGPTPRTTNQPETGDGPAGSTDTDRTDPGTTGTADTDGRPSIVPADVSRWEADHLAVVVAETEHQAEAAALLLRPRWEQLPIIGDLDEALAAGAPILHPEAAGATEPPSNAYHHYVIRNGDATTAMVDAEVVVEGTYEVPYQEHAFLQPEAAVAYRDDQGRITVETGGQWTHEDQEQVAHALNLPIDEVRIIYRAIGGAFGGKEDMSLQIVLALAVRKLSGMGIDRPVRCQWSREESIVGHHKRHRGRISTRWGATADGRIVAVTATGHLDAGAYNYTSNKVLGNLHLTVAGPYRIPNAHIDSWAVYTNAVPGGAFRGFGGPQGCFVAESQMNKLAEACGIDPVEIRRRNMLTEGSLGITGTEMPPGVSLPEVIDACADAAAWTEPLGPAKPMNVFASVRPSVENIRRGRGFACAYKNVGFSFGFPERSEAKIVLHGPDRSDADDETPPESAEVFLAGADVGQGAHTAFLQMTAEATGLETERITGHFSDTGSSGDSGSASASRLSFMTGNAILGAAEEAEKAWREGARPAEGFFRYVPPPTEPLDPEGRPTVPNFAYGYVAEAVDLSVDVTTGHIVVHDVVCAVDVGRAINPNLIEGQVEGAVVQAHGYALSENLQVADGRVLNPRFSGYLIPGIGDVPEQVRTVCVEVPDPRGPFGVRGMAEMPLIPYAPAVTAALFDATGVWFDQFPLTPGRVLAGLSRAAA